MAAQSSVTSAGAAPRRSCRDRLRPCPINMSSCRQKGNPTGNAAGKRWMRKYWEHNQIVEFSKMIYNYKALRHHLPETSDTDFWAWCCTHFKGCFTMRQLSNKMRRLELRHDQISSGRAKSIKLRERVIFDIWTAIKTCNASSSPPNIPTTPPVHPHTFYPTPLTAPSHEPPISPPAAPCTSSLSSGAPPHPVPVVAEDVGVEDHEQSVPEKHSNDNATASPPRSSHQAHAYEGQNTPGVRRDAGHHDTGDQEGGSVGAEEQHESSSTCAVNKKTEQENKFGFALLYHGTIADLASTTKALAEATRMLAEVLQSNGPPNDLYEGKNIN